MAEYEIEAIIDGVGIWPKGADKRTVLPITVTETMREAERQVELFKAADKCRKN